MVSPTISNDGLQAHVDEFASCVFMPIAAIAPPDNGKSMKKSVAQPAIRRLTQRDIRMSIRDIQNGSLNDRGNMRSTIRSATLIGTPNWRARSASSRTA